MIAALERQGAHTTMDPIEYALRAIVRRLLAQGVELEPEHVEWWAGLLRAWPAPIDRLAA